MKSIFKLVVFLAAIYTLIFYHYYKIERARDIFPAIKKTSGAEAPYNYSGLKDQKSTSNAGIMYKFDNDSYSKMISP